MGLHPILHIRVFSDSSLSDGLALAQAVAHNVVTRKSRNALLPLTQILLLDIILPNFNDCKMNPLSDRS